MDLGPVGIKYWGGWGDGTDISSQIAGSAGSINDIIKTLQMGSLENIVMETENTKLLSMKHGENRISILMEKDVDHNKFYTELK